MTPTLAVSALPHPSRTPSPTPAPEGGFFFSVSVSVGVRVRVSVKVSVGVRVSVKVRGCARFETAWRFFLPAPALGTSLPSERGLVFECVNV